MKLFITGIGTNVGKTIASAIVTQALEADYWKPVQAGDLDHSDSHKILSYISNDQSVIHENSYKLNTPASPHLAAEIDGITIDLKNIKEYLQSDKYYKFLPQNYSNTILKQINCSK